MYLDYYNPLLNSKFEQNSISCENKNEGKITHGENLSTPNFKFLKEESKKVANDKITMSDFIQDQFTKINLSRVKKFYITDIPVQGKVVYFLLYSQLPDTDLYVPLSEPFYENNFLLINNKPYSKKSCTVKKNYLKQLRKLILKNQIVEENILFQIVQTRFENSSSEYNLEVPKTFNELKEIYQKLIIEIKNWFALLEFYNLTDNKKFICENLLDEIASTYNKLNTFSVIILKSFKDALANQNMKSKSKNKSKYKGIIRLYNCFFCTQKFSSGQSLGGHMSRAHPHMSEKHMEKQMIRNRRKKAREILTKAKIKLLEAHSYNFNDLNKNSQTRRIMRKIIQENRQEYEVILTQIRRKNN